MTGSTSTQFPQYGGAGDAQQDYAADDASDVNNKKRKLDGDKSSIDEPQRKKTKHDPQVDSASPGADALPGAGTVLHIDALLQLYAETGATSPVSGKASANDSLVSNPNGAPQIDGFSVNLSPDELMDALVHLQNKVQQFQLETIKDGLLGNVKKLEDQKAILLDKIKSWIDKCQAARNKAKTAKIGTWIKRCLTIFGAGLAVVLGFATGVGAVPLLALAAIAIALTLKTVVDSTNDFGWTHFSDKNLAKFDAGYWVGKGAELGLKKLGVGKDKAETVGTVFQVATSIALMIAMVVLSGGVSSVGKFSEAGRLAQLLAGAIGGMNEIDQGFRSLDIAKDRHDADLIQSQKKEIEAIIMQMQQQMGQENDELKKILDEIQQNITTVSEIIRSSGNNKTQINQNLGSNPQTA